MQIQYYLFITKENTFLQLISKEIRIHGMYALISYQREKNNTQSLLMVTCLIVGPCVIV